MIIRSLLGAFVSLLMSCPAWAFPEAEVLSTRYINAADCVPPEDSLMVLVRDNSDVIARYDYCSSYGQSRAFTFVDGHKRLYVAIEYGVGRGSGPGAVQTFLKIMGVDRGTGSLYPLAYALLHGEWYSHYNVIDTNDGVEVYLTYDQGRKADCCKPPADEIHIHVGP